MKPFVSSFSVIFDINRKLFGAALFVVLAWLCWPSGITWWGFGLLSLFMGLAAIMLLTQALQQAIKLKTRDETIATFSEQGEQPKGSAVVSSSDLDDAGMR